MISTLLNATFRNNVHIQAFADDISILVSGTTRQELERRGNETLEIIDTWSRE